MGSMNHATGNAMRVMLLCSSFNGLSQRVWLDLRAAGHDVRVELSSDMDAVRAAALAFDPTLIVCPFLRERVPDDLWMRYRTIIIHPGPIGDRGPSSLDWAITEGATTWGVTALQAVREFDDGPVWTTRTFPIRIAAPRKGSLYNGPVSAAAVDLVREVVAKATDLTFVPPRAEDYASGLRGRERPVMRQVDRGFAWSDPTTDIVRRIRAADGSPGVRTTLCGQAVFVYDAQPGPAEPAGQPGMVAACYHGAVLVHTGDGTMWIGQVRRADRERNQSIKLPATMALAEFLGNVPELIASPSREAGFRDVSYARLDHVGVVSFDFYNGAMSSTDCRRLAGAIRRAAAQSTRVLVIRGGDPFSNGIHLNVIEAAEDPRRETWHNINAIDDVCREIITNTDQLVIAAVGGNAGAGGVMLALGADRVLLRGGAVLNPHYRTMGLYGSEYWTYVLPRRVGPARAQQLTEQCLPIDAAEATRIGLVDQVLPSSPDEFDAAVIAYATTLGARNDYHQLLAAKRDRRERDERSRPLESYRAAELGEMIQDIYHGRNDFAAARRAFVAKQPRPGRPSSPVAGRTGYHLGHVSSLAMDSEVGA
jgi:putative two-component system protein, hydrogenase maturation factor HypX/HoxX